MLLLDWQTTLQGRHAFQTSISGLRNSLGCFSHVKNIDLHYITSAVADGPARPNHAADRA